MYTLKDRGILWEIECGNNFGYVLEDGNNFSNTDYKVLQSQTRNIFIPCMKMLYNGKTKLYYVVDDYRPLSSMIAGMPSDTLITIILNLAANVIKVRNNGFLLCQNIDLSWDKIFVDANTLKVQFIYLPINLKIFDNYAEFENELRSSMIKLINKVVINPDGRMEQLLGDLRNGLLTLEDICNKSKGNTIMNISESNGKNVQVRENTIRLVAMNAPEHFEIVIEKAEVVIGKKAEIVDVVIPFNKMISRKHCRVSKRNGEYYITDEGSANGTYVNRIRLTSNKPYLIKKGDIIRLANSDFQIV